MKVFVGYHCGECGADFDLDSRTLSHSDPKCPVCGCNAMVKRVYKEAEE